MVGHEAMIRFFFFAGLVLVLLLLEVARPRRVPSQPLTGRRLNNFFLVAIDSVLVQILFPVLPAAFALQAHEQGWGFLNQAGLPEGLALVCAVVLFDFVIYLQHVLFHTFPVLWRFHLVHHTDLDFDFSTGIRFHPAEIIISMGIKLGVVYLIGPPAAAVLIFEVILNGTSMFSHSNIRLPGGADTAIRFLLVTPDMHRVHHSVIIRERNANFGFNLSCWDRLLGTYRDQPEKGHEGMTIGLANFRNPAGLTLARLLILPFGAPAGKTYP